MLNDIEKEGHCERNLRNTSTGRQLSIDRRDMPDACGANVFKCRLMWSCKQVRKVKTEEHPDRVPAA